MSKRYTDPVTAFTHRLHQLKLIIFELFLLATFLYGIWSLARHEFQWNGAAPQQINQSPSPPLAGMK